MIQLRAYLQTDFDCLAAIRRDFELQDCLMSFPSDAAPSDVEIRAWIEGRLSDENGSFRVIADCEQGNPIGFVQLASIHKKAMYGKIGIAIARDMRRKGAALSAVNAMSHRAKDADGLIKLMADIRADNIASLALFRSANFREVGIMRNHYRGRDVVLLEKIL